MKLKHIIAILVAVLVSTAAIFGVSAAETGASGEITVLFTHDLHSHLLPSANESGEGEYGGYARIIGW